MRRSIAPRVVLAALVALAAWACDSGNTVIPTAPTPNYVTSTFEGTLTVNGAQTFSFPAVTAGTVKSTLTSLGPDSGLEIGMSLGTWSGSVCTLVVTDDSVAQGATVTATSSAGGALCVRVYDVGQLVAPLPFLLTVVHP
jgi:hypothetical protein